jgi:hypothetical protein
LITLLIHREYSICEYSMKTTDLLVPTAPSFPAARPMGPAIQTWEFDGSCAALAATKPLTNEKTIGRKR